MGPYPAQALDQPSPFGRFELLKLLGTGGMAEVFLARARGPKGFERVVVIKRILPHLCADEEFVEMFVSEAKVSSILSHGNIVQVYEFGEADGQLFLAIEHVDGTDLRSLLHRLRKQGGRFGPLAAVHLASRVLEALAYAHTRTDPDGRALGIVHRDVSPSNVLISRAGDVKLCDFGIAKIATHHTSSGRLKGKMAYMSPEQIAGAVVDARSDLWSVGVALWETLSGRKLFHGNSDVDTLARVRTAPVPPLPAIGIPHEDRLRAIIDCALQRDPDRRYRDAATFADDLLTLSALSGGDPRAELRELVRRTDEAPSPRTVPAIASAETAILEAPAAAAMLEQDLEVEPEAEAEAEVEVAKTTTSPSASFIRPVRSRSGLLLAAFAAAVAIGAAVAIVLWPHPDPRPVQALPIALPAPPPAPPPPLPVLRHVAPLPPPAVVPLPPPPAEPATGADAPPTDPVPAPVKASPAKARPRVRHVHREKTIDPF